MYFLPTKKGYWPLFVLLYGFFIVTSCNEKPTSLKPKQNPPTIVDVVVAKSQPVANNLEVNGNVVANEYVELHPEASGRLIYLNVPEGQKVKTGTIIARVNDADLRAQYGKTKVLLDLAQKTEARYKQLLAVNGMNQSDYDAALNTVNGYKADLEYTQALLDKTVLKAPFDGVVGLRQVSLGAYVSPTTLIATMQQLDRIKIDFTLPESYSSFIHVNDAVDVEIDAANKKQLRARVIAIEPQVNQASRNLTVRAILQQGKLNPGAFVKVYVHVSVDMRAILVPTNCIIPDDKNNQVILVKNGSAQFVNVQTGSRQSNNVAITKGISAGDTVVVTGVLFARPMAPLQVRSVKTLEQFAAVNNNTNGTTNE